MSTPRIRRTVGAGAVCAIAALAATGCGFEPRADELAFTLAPATLRATEAAPEVRTRLLAVLEEAFGTPAQPRYARTEAWGEGVDTDHEALEGYPSLARSAELYRRECLACHGVEGGGDGPSAFGLSPRPRDFRLGIFKYTALKDQSRPRREDVLRTLEVGVPGTSMPNFQRLAPSARAGLADYVRFLAIRGEVEGLLAAGIQEEGELASGAFEEAAGIVWGRWQRAATRLVAYDGEVPRSTPERIARGDALFHDGLRGNCASCHGALGAGDGPAAWKIGISGQREPAYVDAWGQPIVPRDLRQGLFGGGSRPIDLYRRIFAGIPGGPMPAMGTAVDKEGRLLLSSDDIWCLVHYVRSLSARDEEP